MLYSDNSTLTWRSIECNATDYNWFNAFMYWTMVDDIAPTDMSTVQKAANPCGSGSDNPNDDIYWFATAQANLVTPTAVGDYTCMSQSGTGSENCQRGRMRWLETLRTDGLIGTQWNIACHEITHGVGFQHGNTQLSCMDSGDNGILDTYMKDRINAKW